MKKLTKMQQQLLSNYERAKGYHGLRNVCDCYAKPSTAKTRAETLIKRMAARVNDVTYLYACDYTVVSYNVNTFSSAYSVYDYQPSKRVDELTLRAVVYYTAYNRYIIPFDDTIEQELDEVFYK